MADYIGTEHHELHAYDCLCANKSMAAWGVEARVPFLDQEFIDVAMRLNPAAKMATDGKMEKHVLREAFEDLLPDPVAWRQKEQFSDGVGYSWIDSLHDACAWMVPSEKSVACSTPEALAWDESFADSADPSGRAVRGVHAQAYN